MCIYIHITVNKIFRIELYKLHIIIISLFYFIYLLFTGRFFKYKFIYFNWRLITSQYCIGSAIHQHEATTCIHMFPILNPPLSPLPVLSLFYMYNKLR